ncbi:hypothetical protein HHL16_23375 [Pseudoflavitalea sp. G-6-1-2]|uniref:hypothetical protein n=1 Tax=Pseudoflavitalea sp. G-6-1-2 TaxID=2728841 RepID=UPI00146C0578|nr:hypothetical protein [Pseudoflavitalea sp. G-6-1-2]NML23841.1 hypothetical protein [Pseudoflavitalea sp. G-6-1-2]
MFVVLLGLTGWGRLHAQHSSIQFLSSDNALQTAFYRAKEMALSYQGKSTDPVGPWYEAALPERSAFCIRDVSHQCIPAEMLGMHRENRNMFTHFLSNISESKDWCTFWEMNKYGKPAPEDYRNDTAFWYNLNANFELVHACWRLYNWTGDSSYIAHPVAKKFFQLTMHQYIDRWILQVDSLLKRPPFPNAPQPFNFNDYFHRCRGLPSYYESLSDMQMGVDLVAAIYRSMISYAGILKTLGDDATASIFLQKAEAYRQHLEANWWDASKQRYNTWYNNKGVFGRAEGDVFLLWTDALTDTSRIRGTLDAMRSGNWNVENLSYAPLQYCKYGKRKEAYEIILHLTNPATKRREYPEVSFGVLEGIVQGLMGLSADAAKNRIRSINNLGSSRFSEISNLSILGNRIRLKHWMKGASFTNEGRKPLWWRAAFHGKLSYITAGGRKIKASHERDLMGNWITYVDLQVSPGKKITASIP